MTGTTGEDDSLVPTYRAAKPISFELVQHSGIFFEEKLCSFNLRQTKRKKEEANKSRYASPQPPTKHPQLGDRLVWSCVYPIPSPPGRGSDFPDTPVDHNAHQNRRGERSAKRSAATAATGEHPSWTGDSQVRPRVCLYAFRDLAAREPSTTTRR